MAQKHDKTQFVAKLHYIDFTHRIWCTE